MTGLTAFTPKTDTVQIPDGEFAVRGLALEDFTILLRSHYEPMAALFEQYVNEAALEKVDADVSGGVLNLGDMKGVALKGLEMAPALIGDVIARAADETDNPHVARLLPVGTQIEAIGKIVTLTLEAEGGLEKLVETITQLAATLATATVDRSP